MSWQQYVARHKAGRSQVDLADLVEVSQTAVSRWLKGTQSVDAAVAIRFARAVGDEPLTALVEAGYLTPEEAGATPAGQPDYSQLTNDELLQLVRTRMREEGGSGGYTAPRSQAGTAGNNVHTLTPDDQGDPLPPTDLEQRRRKVGPPVGVPLGMTGLLGRDALRGLGIDAARPGTPDQAPDDATGEESQDPEDNE